MKRRQFLTKGAAGVAGAAAVSSFAAPAIAQKRTEMVMVSTWPRDFPGLGTGAQRLAKRIDDMSEGPHQGSRTTPPRNASARSLRSTKSPRATPRPIMPPTTTGKASIPGWAYFTAVPFGLTYTEMNAWIRFGGGQQLWDELAKVISGSNA